MNRLDRGQPGQEQPLWVWQRTPIQELERCTWNNEVKWNQWGRDEHISPRSHTRDQEEHKRLCQVTSHQGLQIKITSSYPLPPGRMAKIKTSITKYWWKCGASRIYVHERHTRMLIAASFIIRSKPCPTVGRLVSRLQYVRSQLLTEVHAVGGWEQQLGGLLLSCFRGVQLCVPYGLAPQAPLSMGFSRQEYWWWGGIAMPSSRGPSWTAAGRTHS